MKNQKKKTLTTQQKLEVIRYYQVYLFVLTPLRRRIWRYLQNFHVTAASLYMNVETIAKECRCSVRTVQYALKQFEEMNWLKRKIRPYKSSLYIIPDIYCIKKIRTLKDCEKIIESLQEKEDPAPSPMDSSFSERVLHPVCRVSFVSLGHYDIHSSKARNEHILKHKTQINPADYPIFDRFSEHEIVWAIEKCKHAYHSHKARGTCIQDRSKYMLKVLWNERKKTKGIAK